MTSPTLLVMAAGMGSRYGGLKQIDPVGPSGETILDYSIFDAQRGGFSKVVFVIRKEIEQPFRQLLGARLEKRIAVEYVFQELDALPPGFTVPAGRTKPWGTTHAILVADSAVHEPFAVINADDFYGAAGYRVLAQYLTSGTKEYAMVGFALNNTLSEFGTVSRGICRVDDDNCLQGVTEFTKIERDGAQVRNTDSQGAVTKLTGDEIVSMNMWGFTPRVFGQLREDFEEFLELRGSEMAAESFIPSTVSRLIQTGRARVKVLRTNDSWFGITYREDRVNVVESINRLIRDGYYPERLWL